MKIDSSIQGRFLDREQTPLHILVGWFLSLWVEIYVQALACRLALEVPVHFFGSDPRVFTKGCNEDFDLENALVDAVADQGDGDVISRCRGIPVPVVQKQWVGRRWVEMPAGLDQLFPD